jgi:hypothetical protein
MKFLIKHYYDFDANNEKINSNLLSKESWDIIRTEDIETPFSIPKDRLKWLDKCLSCSMYRVAKEIIYITKKYNLTNVTSAGVGIAALEFNIKKYCPSIKLICLDYAPQAIKRLKHVFIECDQISEFDITSKVWENNDNTLYLLNRISTEFDDMQLEEIFFNMFSSNIKYICLIPTELLNLKIALKEKSRYLINKMSKKKMSFAGYMRTKDSFESLWSKYYQIEEFIEVEENSLFLLKRI